MLKIVGNFAGVDGARRCALQVKTAQHRGPGDKVHVAATAAEGQFVGHAVVGVFGQKSFHETDQVVVETAAETFVGTEHHEQNFFQFLARGEQRVHVRIDVASDAVNELVDLVGEVLGLPLGVLGFAQFTRGNHFHGFRDLAGVAQAAYFTVVFLDARHRGSLSEVQRRGLGGPMLFEVGQQSFQSCFHRIGHCFFFVQEADKVGVS